MKDFAAIIYDAMNIVIRVEERPSRERATKAGEFYTKRGGWYKIIEGRDEIEMYKSMINL